jgi:hypothetical protein
MPANAGDPTPRVLGFDDDTTVDVRQLDDVTWAVLRPLGYQAALDRLVVPIGQRTDFASVPRVFVWLLPRYGRYTKAAILHDYLWRVAVPAGRITLIDADGILRQAMRELGVPFLRRWIMWAAVRWGALTKPGGRKGWLSQGALVLLVTTVALPIVLPAAAVISITLPVFYLAELIAWVPLQITHRVQVARGKPTRTVNRPTMRWKT